MPPIPRRALLAFLAATLACTFAATAQTLPQPEGPVILTVSGLPDGQDGSVRFDREQLRTLPATTYRTSTIWTQGEQAFTGVTLRDLMAALGVEGQSLRAHAINDYAIDIPWTDVADGSALLAYDRNGEAMSVRDKGPLWIVYPYDSDVTFRGETYHARSIWQLDRIVVTD